MEKLGWFYCRPTIRCVVITLYLVIRNMNEFFGSGQTNKSNPSFFLNMCCLHKTIIWNNRHYSFIPKWQKNIVKSETFAGLNSENIYGTFFFFDLKISLKKTDMCAKTIKIIKLFYNFEQTANVINYCRLILFQQNSFHEKINTLYFNKIIYKNWWLNWVFALY